MTVPRGSGLPSNTSPTFVGAIVNAPVSLPSTNGVGAAGWR